MNILSDVQVRRLIKCLDPEFKDMVTIMWSLALRINEVTQLTRAQVDLESEQVRIIGKGNQERLLPFFYAESKIFPRVMKANNALYVFEKSYTYPYGNRQVRQAIYDAATKAKLPNVHPHTLRHSRATWMLDNNLDSMRVKQLLGHKDIRTTDIYINYSVEGLRRAMAPFK